MNPSNILVVFYSHSGTTRVLANLVAAALDADVEEVQDIHPRHGALGWLRSAIEATFGTRAAIEPQRRDPRHYDLVLVGTPVWNAHVSSPIRSWLMDNAGRLPRVAFFATLGGRGGDETVAEMSALVPAVAESSPAARPTWIVRNDDVWAGRTYAPVSAFVHAVLDLTAAPRSSGSARSPRPLEAAAP